MIFFEDSKTEKVVLSVAPDLLESEKSVDVESKEDFN